MNPNLQPTDLFNDFVRLVPLQQNDFDALYAVACDPLIWEQHPNPDRYKKEVFENYFKGAMESGGAMLIKNSSTNEIIGSSRFYDFDAEKNCINIGYTFFARSYWGKPFNSATKKLMIEYMLQFVNNIYFQVGAQNFRSQKAMEKLGAQNIGQEEVAYYGEASRLNYIYLITKSTWEIQ